MNSLFYSLIHKKIRFLRSIRDRVYSLRPLTPKAIILGETSLNYKKNSKSLSTYYLLRLHSYIKLRLISFGLKSLLSNFVFKHKKFTLSIFPVFSSFINIKMPYYVETTFYSTVPGSIKAFPIMLSFYFFESSVLADFIIPIFKEASKKNQLRKLSEITNSITSIFSLQIFPIMGLRFCIKGKLGGKLRKSKYKFKIGISPLSYYTVPVSFSSKSIYTRHGVFSIKVWLTQRITNPYTGI